MPAKITENIIMIGTFLLNLCGVFIVNAHEGSILCIVTNQSYDFIYNRIDRNIVISYTRNWKGNAFKGDIIYFMAL